MIITMTIIMIIISYLYTIGAQHPGVRYALQPGTPGAGRQGGSGIVM